MTHLFEVSKNEMRQLTMGHKRFDVLNFRRAVSVGDTILYQLVQPESDGEEDKENSEITDVQFDEYPVKIDFLFDDTEGALKKGFVAVGFEFSQTPSE